MSKPTCVALVRAPSDRVAEGIVTHIERRPVDAIGAREQWRLYVKALEVRGWSALEIAPSEGSPDGVFVEDTMTLYDDLAVIARPAAAVRRLELASAEQTITALGYSLTRITPPGTLEGGDVLRVGTRVYVGVGGRTNRAGVQQLRGLLEPLGAHVTELPLAATLHLKSALGTLPDGRLVGYPPLLVDTAVLPTFEAIPEPSGAQLVALDDRTLLLAADCPRSAELYVRLGYAVEIVEISEFQKLEGAVSCLSVLATRA